MNATPIASSSHGFIRSGIERAIDLTRHKISDREPAATCSAAKAWMANTQNVGCSLTRGSLHRLVRSFSVYRAFQSAPALIAATRNKEIQSSLAELSSHPR